MAKYYIPSRFRQGFKSLIELDDASLKLITDKIANFPIGGGHSALIDFLHDLPISNIDEISATIYSFGNILLDKPKELEEVSKGLVFSFLSEQEDTENFDNADNYISNLLNVFRSAEKVKTSYKALSLATDVPNILRETNILTDIRMVFDDDLSSINRHALISQQIKIIYSDNGEEKAFYANLDKKDLEILRDQIERALGKERILKSEYSEIFKIIDIGE